MVINVEHNDEKVFLIFVPFVKLGIEFRFLYGARPGENDTCARVAVYREGRAIDLVTQGAIFSMHAASCRQRHCLTVLKREVCF